MFNSKSIHCKMKPEGIKMKKIKFIYLVMMVLVLFTGGCTAGNYVFSGGMGKHKIEVHATDGAYGESYDFAVGRNQKVVLKPDLSEGELQIDFAPATVIMTDPDTPEDVIIGEVLETVKVSGKEEVSVVLPEDSYVMEITSIGASKGTVNIEIVDNN